MLSLVTVPTKRPLVDVILCEKENFHQSLFAGSSLFYHDRVRNRPHILELNTRSLPIEYVDRCSVPDSIQYEVIVTARALANNVEISGIVIDGHVVGEVARASHAHCETLWIHDALVFLQSVLEGVGVESFPSAAAR